MRKMLQIQKVSLFLHLIVFGFYVVTCQFIFKKFGQKAVNTPRMITSRYNITLKGVGS